MSDVAGTSKKVSIWQRFWCWLDDHGGIGNDNRCKRCGARVRI